ncbi:unnamed protein product, partial [marine sediment metagenome]
GEDKNTRLCFISMKQTLKRDLKKYNTYIDKQKANGKKGGRPKKVETQKTQPFIEKPKKADSVSVSVSDSVNEKNINNNGELNYDPDYIIADNTTICHIKNVANDIIKDEEWKITIIKKYGFTTQDIFNGMDHFNNEEISKGETQKSIKDYKFHFSRWLKKYKGGFPFRHSKEAII